MQLQLHNPLQKVATEALPSCLILRSGAETGNFHRKLLGSGSGLVALSLVLQGRAVLSLEAEANWKDAAICTSELGSKPIMRGWGVRFIVFKSVPPT